MGGLADDARRQPAPAPIALARLAGAEAGTDVDAAQVRDILKRLEFKVAGPDDTFAVTPPSWRATKDVAMKDDLVEEVGRMIGYDSIHADAAVGAVGVPPENPQREFLRAGASADGRAGIHRGFELFVPERRRVRAFGFDPDDHVRVLNPIAADQELLRPSLLPGIRKNIVENASTSTRSGCSKSGTRFISRRPDLPVEIPHLAAAIFARDDGQAGLFEAEARGGVPDAGREAGPMRGPAL